MPTPSKRAVDIDYQPTGSTHLKVEQPGPNIRNLIATHTNQKRQNHKNSGKERQTTSGSYIVYVRVGVCFVIPSIPDGATPFGLSYVHQVGSHERKVNKGCIFIFLFTCRWR